MKVWIVEVVEHSKEDFRVIRSSDVIGVYETLEKAREAVNKVAVKQLSGLVDRHIFWRDILGKGVEYTIVTTESNVFEYIVERRKVK